MKTMKTRILSLIIAAATLLAAMPTAGTAGVDIPSPWNMHGSAGITDEILAEMVASGEIPRDAKMLFLAKNNITDITPLAMLTELEWLDLDCNQITDVTPLQSLTKLRELRLGSWGGNKSQSCNQVSDITPLFGLVNLESLDITNNPVSLSQYFDFMDAVPNCRVHFGSYAANHGYYNLTNEQLKLMIANGTISKDTTDLSLYSGDITDLSPLTELPNLKTLYLFCPNISNISSLAEVKSLQNLIIGRSNEIDISPLAELPNLQQLEFFETTVTDISPLETMTSLVSFYLNALYGNNNKVSGISAIGNLTNLRSLGLTNIDLTDITPLSSLTKLNFLTLVTSAEESIIDISPLGSLTNLRKIQMYGGYIDDISPLGSLTNLREIQMYGGYIDDISPLSNLTELRKLQLTKVRDIDIFDLLPLKNLVEADFSYYIPIDETKGMTGMPVNLTVVEAIKLHDAMPRCEFRGVKVMLAGQWIGIVSCFSSSRVNLQGREFENYDFAPIAAQLPDTITTLMLGWNNISDLTLLEKFVNVEYLCLLQNPITDLEPLTKLTNLKSIELHGTRVLEDISPLASIPTLESLQLWGNNISDITPLKSLTNLKQVSLHGNPLTLKQLVELKRALPDCEVQHPLVEWWCKKNTHDSFGMPTMRRNCDCCEPCWDTLLGKTTEPARIGHVLGNDVVTVEDALEILKYIVGIDSIIADGNRAFNAALITGGDIPGMSDVLEILKHLVGMESKLSGLN